jgi:bifunctional NMN adenylyltransferase/nudix hydrolase
MRTIEQAKTDVAAVVGRWQVDDLHAGHKELLDSIREQHRKVIVFVGVPDILGAVENPLDFPSRAAMILQHYPDFTVLPIRDCHGNEEWSERLDFLVRTVAPVGEITFYGGRDSFITHYTGRFKTIELDALRHPSGTDIREEVGRTVRASSDFRAGVIYSAFNQYRKVHMVVDIAVIRGDNVLLIQKPGEKSVGFCGGFVDASDSCLEAAARREAVEETGIFPEYVEYQGTFIIPDRRMGKNDTMMSAFFIGKTMTNTMIKVCKEELAGAEWYPIAELRKLSWFPNHVPMFEVLCKKLGV